MKGSWKTSSAGATAILLALAGLFVQVAAVIDGDPETVIDMNAAGAALAALAAGVGNIFSRDNDVTSEEAGVK